MCLDKKNELSLCSEPLKLLHFSVESDRDRKDL